MAALLSNYSFSEIVVFVVALALALKEFVTFIDWAKNRLREIFDKDYQEAEKDKELREEVEELKELNKLYGELEKVDSTFEKINATLDMLIASDKETIKSYVTDQHHKLVYDQGWIDDYTMECLEKRFAIYQEESGNSFVAGLMSELRSLPRQPVETEAQFDRTRTFVDNEHKK